MLTNRIIGILTILLVSFYLAVGPNQQLLKDADYASYPYWMAMMQDPQDNFFETEKASNLSWKDREIPKEESACWCNSDN